jgi:hypothetical protein
MGPLVKKILWTFFLVFIVICFFGFGKLKKFAHDARESQKIALMAVGGNAPRSAPQESQISPFSSDKPEERTKQPQGIEKIAAATSLPGEDSKYTYSELIKDVQKRPLINTCTLLEGDGTPLFKKLLERPSGFELLVIDQRLEVGLIAYRLPINQALALQLDENPSLFHDMRFSLDFYRAQKELEVNLPLARQIETRGYYTRILAKILRQNPNLIGDPAVSALCDEFANIQRPTSQEEMNKEMYAFMQRAQVKPEEIDFNPNFKPTVEVVTGAEGNKFYFLKKIKK